MLVLGIDPGTATTGYGYVRQAAGNLVVVDYGVVRTPARADTPGRLLAIYQRVQELLRACRPDAVAAEELFFNRNTTTAMAVGQARGVLLLAAAQQGVPVYEYTPSQVKQAVAGYGKADKHQVQAMVKAILRMDTTPTPDDAADALAVAICHLHSARLGRLGKG